MLSGCRSLSRCATHAYLLLCVLVQWSSETSTGRLASNNPNLQNLPRKKTVFNSELDGVNSVDVRDAFHCPPGYTFVSADYCQIEMRVLAHLSNEESLVRSFQDPSADIFVEMGRKWLKKAAHESIDDSERTRVKTVVYGTAAEASEVSM